MNSPGSRAELEAMGFTLQSRTRCRSKLCGATIEFWRGPSGRLVPFRVNPRNGLLVQHSDECPGKHEFARQEVRAEKPVAEKPKEQPKREKELQPQGRLF